MNNFLDRFEANNAQIMAGLQNGTAPEADIRQLAERMVEYTINFVPIAAALNEHIRSRHALARPFLTGLSAYPPTPIVVSDEGRTYTPRKVLRRVIDHLIDHWSQVEQIVMWQTTGLVPTPADGWITSMETLNDDLIPLSERELSAWLWRIDTLVDAFAHRLLVLDPDQARWQPPSDNWSIETVVYHVSHAHLFYATALAEALPLTTVEKYTVAADRLRARMSEALVSDDRSSGLRFWDEQIYTAAELINRLLDEQSSLLHRQ